MFLSVLLGQQALALDCVAPPEQPFETATSVFLAQVTEHNPDSTSAPIMIVKVYKGNIDQITKDNPRIEFSDVMSVAPAYTFVKGQRFLLYDQTLIGDCNYLNKQVNAKQIKAFEKVHKPVWVKSRSWKKR